MIITLVAVLCHGFGSVPLCQEVIITTSDYPVLVGKVDHPISRPGVRMMECKLHAQASIAKWINENHPTWWAQGWKCVPGPYETGGRA